MGGLTKNGILIHNFPSKYQMYVYSVFDDNSISRMECDEMGLKIYFEHYDYTKKYILMKTVTVKGYLYNIYPLLTNLTVHGVAPHLNESDIERRMKEAYSHVVKVYSVKAQNSYENCEATTDDYRVILDVPEVLANFQPTPLAPHGESYVFPVTFFCRLCRQDNHKQYQCNYTSTSNCNEQSPNRSDLSPYSPYESFDKFRYFDNRIQMTLIPPKVPETKPPASENTPNADHTMHATEDCWRKMESKAFNQPASHDLGDDYGNDSIADFSQNYANVPSSSNHSFNRRITANNPSSLGNHAFESVISQKSFKAGIPRNDPKNETLTSKILIKEDNQVSRITRDRNLNPEYTRYTAAHDKEDLDIGYVAETDGEDESTSRNKDVFRSKPEVVAPNEHRSDAPRTFSFEKSNKKHRSGIQLVRILPPNLNKKIIPVIKAAITTGNRDISEDVENHFREILQWNIEWNQRNLNQREKKFVRWIELFLRKSRVNQLQGDVPRKGAVKKKDSSVERSTELSNNKTGVFSQSAASEEKCSTNGSVIKRGYLLSPVIKSVIIHKVRGKLDPRDLINFLKQVRGRKKVIEIADYFLKDTVSLINQLDAVRGAYYRSGFRGKDGDKDIKWIQCLCKKLQGSLDASKRIETPSVGI